MGAWGIMQRQSDQGLDWLGVIVEEQLKKVAFSTFNVSEAHELLRRDIQSEIDQYHQKEHRHEWEVFYLETLTDNFTRAAVLIAECLAEYYQTGELVIYDYVGESYDQVEYRIKDFIVTSADLQSLLEVLQSVQDSEHWLYQSWRTDDGSRQEWLTHIQSVYQTLNEHI